MIIKHHLIFQLFAIFLLYTNNPTKSRINERQVRLNYPNGLNQPKTLYSDCPTIPKCHWARFEELKLKVQQGAQSSVSILVDHYNKEPVVKKIFTDKHDYNNEVKALSCLRVGHNPLLVYPLCVDPMKMTMVLEWGGEGDLTRWDLFRDPFVKYSYEDVVKLSAQIVASVAAAHRRGFLHADIKPENFVVNLKSKATKLIDFGLSARLGEYRIMTQGTPQTMAPEVAFPDFFRNRLFKGPNVLISEKEFKSVSERPQLVKEAMDWWSVGVTIHYLFYKYYEDESRKYSSEEGKEHQDNFSKSESENYNETTSSESESSATENHPSISIPEGESDDHYFPYKILWTADGRDILNFQFRSTHPSFSPVLLSFLNKLMAWDPEARNFNRRSLESEILRHELFESIDWNEIDPNLPN